MNDLKNNQPHEKERIVTKEAKTTTEDGEKIDLIATSLTGDIRDFLLDRVKQLGKPWPAMTEDEQSDQIIQASEAAINLVKQAVRLIAADGRRTMIGQLVKVQVKDKIQCQVDFSKSDEFRHELFDSTGQAVLLVVADAEPFTGERAPAEPIPDQGDLVANAEKIKGANGKVARLHS